MFDDERLYSAPFLRVMEILKINSIDAIGTAAEPLVVQQQPFCDAPANYDRFHAIDVVSGDVRNWEDCYTAQLKTARTVKTPSGHVGLKLDQDEYSQGARVSRYCEYKNVVMGIRAGVNYPKSYCFMQWSKVDAYKQPAWFFIVDTKSFYSKLSTVVDCICGSAESRIDLMDAGAYQKTGGRDGCWGYVDNRLHFTLEFLWRMKVPYYIYPASKDLYDGTEQCELF